MYIDVTQEMQRNIPPFDHIFGLSLRDAGNASISCLNFGNSVQTSAKTWTNGQ